MTFSDLPYSWRQIGPGSLNYPYEIRFFSLSTDISTCVTLAKLKSRPPVNRNLNRIDALPFPSDVLATAEGLRTESDERFVSLLNTKIVVSFLLIALKLIIKAAVSVYFRRDTKFNSMRTAHYLLSILEIEVMAILYAINLIGGSGCVRDRLRFKKRTVYSSFTRL